MSTSGGQVLQVIGMVVSIAGYPVIGTIITAAGSAMIAAAPGEIPKVNDLKVPQLQYGSKLMRMYGSNRTSAALGWYSEKRIIPGDGGGKGEPDAPTADTADIDVLYILAVDSNITAIARVFRNSELVWSQHTDSDDDSIAASAETPAWEDIFFLDGNPAQLPHPVIEAIEGVGNVPAYRHRQCVLIQGLHLGQSGQLPLIEFECVTGDAEGDSFETVLYADNVVEQDKETTLPEGAIHFGSISRIVVRPPGTVGTVRAYSVSSSGQTGAATVSSTIPGGFAFAAAGRGTGDHALMVLGSASIEAMFAAVGDGVNFFATLPNPDNYLGASEIRFAVNGGHLAIGTALALNVKAPGSPTSAYNLGNQGRIYVYTTGSGGHVSTIAAGLGEIVALAMSGSTVWALAGGLVYPFTDALTAPVAGAAIALPAAGLQSIFTSAAGGLTGSNTAGEIYTYSAGAWTLLTTIAYGDSPPVALGTDTVQHGLTGSKVFACDPVSRTVPGSFQNYYWRGFRLLDDPSLSVLVAHTIAAETGAWVTTGGSPRAIRNVQYTLSPTYPPTIDYAEGDGQTYQLALSFDILYGYAGDTGSDNFATPMDTWVWLHHTTTDRYDKYRAGTFSTEKTYFEHDFYRKPIVALVTPGSVDLATIVSAEWARVDDVAKIDVTELEGIPVRGFQSSGSVRGAYEALAPVFHFGAVCSDKLYFRLQGAASVATIAYGQLAAGEDKAADEPFAPVRANDEEVLERAMLTYPNYSDDYANGTETGNRGIGTSTIVAALQTNVVMIPSEAKAVAETLAAMAGIAATIGQITLTDYYAALEPTDAIIVPDGDGNLHRMRIMRETHGRGVKAIDLVRDDVTALIAPGITTGGYTQSLTIKLPAETEIVLLDIPMLRDVDNDPGLYAVAKGAPRGSTLYSSLDGVTYAAEVAFTQQSVFGPCTTILGNWTGGRVFDEVSRVTVNVGEGTLNSATRAALLADQAVNACAIGRDGRWELCQFRTATLLSAGYYTLTGFLRGSRGTEWASTGHAASERFVLLTGAGRRVEVQVGELGVTQYFKGVSAGRSLSSATAETMSPDAVGLEPFAPVNVRVSRATNNDATITFDRRTRLSTRFASSMGIFCPLGEASEAYEIDIYSSDAYTTVVRTLTALTPSVAYTAAQQTSDGLAPGATLYMRVFQISATVARGYPAEAAA